MDSMKDFADLTLPNSDGEEVRFGDLWQDHRLVIVWIRHYG